MQTGHHHPPAPVAGGSLLQGKGEQDSTGSRAAPLTSHPREIHTARQLSKESSLENSGS